MAQSVEHVLGKDEVTSSSLVSSSKNARIIPSIFLSKPKRSKVWYIIKGLSLAYHHEQSECIKRFGLMIYSSCELMIYTISS